MIKNSPFMEMIKKGNVSAKMLLKPRNLMTALIAPSIARESAVKPHKPYAKALSGLLTEAPKVASEKKAGIPLKFDEILKSPGAKENIEKFFNKPKLERFFATNKAVLTLGIPLAGFALYNMAKLMSDKEKTKNTYKEMFEKYPEMKSIPKEKVDEAWNVMKTYAPVLTRNPTAAKSFIKKLNEFEGIDSNEIKELVGIQTGSIMTEPWGDIKDLAYGIKVNPAS